MPSLILHIGHGKTGSSMLQNSFHSSRKALMEHGIYYPSKKSTQPGKITSGNGAGLLNSKQSFANALELLPQNRNDVLFSSELMFFKLSGFNDPRALVKVAREKGFENIVLILLVRNPISHASSRWQQGIKRGGLTQSIEESFNSYQLPSQVARLMVTLTEIDGFVIKILNYSYLAKTLLGEFENLLSLPRDTLVKPSERRTNRSLTWAELEFQLIFNSYLGKSGHLISDPLCQELPNVEPDEIRPSIEVQNVLWDRLLPDIRVVNRFLPKDHEYQKDIVPPSPKSDFLELTTQQLHVIARSLGQQFKQTQTASAMNGAQRSVSSSLKKK